MPRFVVGLLLLCACSAVSTSPVHPPRRPGKSGPRVQGLLGFTDIDGTSLDLATSGDTVLDEGPSVLPALGAALQLPFSEGDRLQLGIEAGVTASWESDTGVVDTGSGTLVVASENDLFLGDVFLGAYASLDLGGSWRVYGGAGPLLQYVSVDLEYTDALGQFNDVEGDGFGAGVYARVGIERWFGSTLFGFGVRWIRAELNPGGGVRELELEGVQFLISATRGM